MTPTPIPYKGYQCDKQGKLIKDTEESILDLQTTDDKDMLTEDLGPSESKEDVISVVVEEYGTTDEPYDGPSFILPNGLFLDLKGKVKHHSDVEKFLISKDLSAYDSIGDTAGSPTLNYLGCIRVDTPKYYIQLPYDQLTSSQYSSIQNWTDYLVTLGKPYVEVIAPKEGPVKYYFDDEIHAPTYVSERIRRYYMSGKLYESGHSPDDYCRKSNCDKDIVEESILDLELSGVKFKNPEISDIIETEDISRDEEDSDEVIKSVLSDVKKEISDTESEEYINKVEDELHKKGISVDADHLGSLMSETVLKESYPRPKKTVKQYEIEYVDSQGTPRYVRYVAKSKADALRQFNGKEPDARRVTCTLRQTIQVDESKNPFKDKHICDGCGKPLSQCTCEIKEESILDDYYYEEDSTVTPGDTFIEDGVEYEWVQPYGDVVHIDFDSWQVWEASDVDTDEDNVESQFFVVDVDTGFIDWGPVDTVEEALSFLKSKQTSEELDECTQVSNIGQHKSSSIDLVEDNSSDLNKELELEPDDILVHKNGSRYKILKPLDGQVKVLNLTSNVVSYISNDYLTSDNFKIESDDT